LFLRVGLIGTIAAIYLVGFSVNILTLLALVLATGMVVNDTRSLCSRISCVSARSGPRGGGQRHVAGLSPYVRARPSRRIFIPLSFLPGQAGGLFRNEFGFTLAIAVLLSSVVTLSLCPMLASAC
jgi:HAE1 family hydrophobic/amphiphilic exporter-1